jgi:hypothetical protein
MLQESFGAVTSWDRNPLLMVSKLRAGSADHVG